MEIPELDRIEHSDIYEKMFSRELREQDEGWQMAIDAAEVFLSAVGIEPVWQ